jgi:transposase
VLCRIGEEVSEKLDIVPAKVRVIRNIRPKYACKKCQGLETEGPTVKIAPTPPEIIPKGIATPGLLAHIAVAKYVDALPLYRQEKIFARSGIELSRSTMAGWMVKVAQACGPIMELLRKELLSGPLINADETPVQVLDEPGRLNTSLSYMWVFRGGPPKSP